MKISTHPQGKLRILETTDLHMHILGYDYFADRPDSSIGLSVLADLVTAQRSKDDAATLLFDNGDFLQGNPLADHVADTLAQDDIHPMAAAMNLLGYDAVTLGNHEFDYGMPFLRRTLDQIACPKVSANIGAPDGPALAAPYIILPADIHCSDGKTRALRVGVTGFGPPQIADWGDGSGLQVTDITDAARTVVPDMKAAGADVVIALCHSGIAGTLATPRMENAVVPLAAIAGIDVVLAGHTHGYFPGPSHNASQTVDPVAGLVHQKPTVMAGHYGSALGVIDLDLAWTASGWQISASHVYLDRPSRTKNPVSKARKHIEALATDYHKATLAQIRQPIARLKTPVNSYFATIVPDLSQQLLAQAMHDRVSQEVAHDGPILAAVSPFMFGGSTGRGHYIDVATGVMTRKDAVAIFPFADALCAVRRTGLELRNWLERAAAHYNQITAGQQVQELLNPLSAAYNCDAIHGLTYTFDLTGPARFDTYGHLINPDARRISSLMCNGKAIADTDTFLVAASSFRIKGGGGFPQVAPKDIVWMSEEKLRDVLISSLKNANQIAAPCKEVWQFHPTPNTRAQFQTAHAAIPHVCAAIHHDGPGCDGREKFSLFF